MGLDSSGEPDDRHNLNVFQGCLLGMVIILPLEVLVCLGVWLVWRGGW